MAPLGAEQLVGRMPATQLGSELTSQIGEALRDYNRAVGKADRGAPPRELQLAASTALRNANRARQPRPGGVIPMIGLRDWSKAYYVVGVRVPEDNPVEA